MRKTMMMMTEAAHKWVSGFHKFPRDMVRTLMKADPASWTEVTTFSPWAEVKVSMPCQTVDGVYYQGKEQCGNLVGRMKDGRWKIEMADGTVVVVTEDGFALNPLTALPRYVCLFQFDSQCDEEWLKNGNGIRLMSESHFRIYWHEEWGYFFGPDMAGYSVYSSHWVPLYKARNLEWHNEDGTGRQAQGRQWDNEEDMC